ncbi:cytochrome P450 [Acidisarcina polymorpha]|uniref:Cytochrome P450 n=2 Tax=Acidisarcina polymorpha TaxID=2211140 RepID=A0A2Z5G6K6_9BACT|nr:cytochrome P450 [Acidisarcina polymorpha]AXC14731.1 cytochrome P450 [Acidisarcina polymorpha]
MFRQSTIDFLTDNAKRYGDLVHYGAGNRKIFQFNHPELIQELLVNDEPRNRRGIVMQRSRFILGDGLLTSEEPLHMRQRRMAAPAFHRQRIAAYGEVISQYSAEMIDRWQPGPLDLHPEMLLLALRIVGKCLFDTDAQAEVKKIAAAVDAFMGFLPLVFLPFSKQIEKLPFGPMEKIRKGGVDLDAIIYGMIAERRKSPGDRGDLLSMLLEATDVEENPEALQDSPAAQKPAAHMTDKQVRDECLTVMLAGHETTANGLSFALWMLAKHPEAQEEVHQEAVRVLGARAPVADDFPRLRYTYMAFAETMRLYPPVWVIGRSCGPEPYDFRGFTMPAGAIFIAPQIVVQRDPRFWPNPEKFDPRRFAEENRSSEGRPVRPKFAYYPFGAGSRQCIGEGLAWMEGVFVLATILRNWRVRPAPGLPEELPMSPLISLRPKHGVPLVLERR